MQRQWAKWYFKGLSDVLEVFCHVHLGQFKKREVLFLLEERKVGTSFQKDHRHDALFGPLVEEDEGNGDGLLEFVQVEDFRVNWGQLVDLEVVQKLWSWD